MSDFLRDPSFKPNEELKAFIDSMFVEEEHPDGHTPKRKPDYKLAIPAPPPMQDEETELAVKLTREEIENFRVNFLEFQDKVSSLGIYTFLYPSLREFGNACQDLSDLVEDFFNKESMSKDGLKNYDQAMKVRQHILAAVLKNYKEKQ